MNTKNLSLAIIAALVLAGGAFYGGTKYAESKKSAGNNSNQNNSSNFRDLSPEERQQRMQQMGGAGRMMRNGQSGSDFANGEVISKDDKSVTVKLRDGGSKIVFFSDKTQVLKFAAGNSDDIVTGEQVMISGSANPDGSITAQSIQIRPQVPQMESQ